MSAGGIKPEFRFNLDAAAAYTIHKGRMPKDVHELREWLREFSEHETKRFEIALQIYREHLEVCNRPMLIQLEHKP